MDKKHISYWEKRVNNLEQVRMKKAVDYIKKLEKEYIKTFNSIQKDIESFYNRYAIENEISYSEAKKLLNYKELSMWKVDVEEYIEKAQAYKYTDTYNQELKQLYIKTRVDRLQALQTDIKAKTYELHNNYNSQATELFIDCTKDVYYRTIYEVDKFLGIGVDFARLNDRVIKDILTYPWSGKDFSSRIHINRDKTVQVLEETLTNGLIRGLSVDKMTKELESKLVISKKNADMLIRTESNFFLNESSARAYEEAGVERYQIMATLDNRTTPICQEQDLKVYKLEDRKVGVNHPPFHVRCRTTTIPYFEDLEGTRIARDKDGKSYKVPNDMNYKEWYNEYVKPNIEPTGIGHWEKDDKGIIIPTKIVKSRYSPKIKGQPNSVIQYYTQKGKQINRDFYDNNGWLTKQINNGPHGNKKNHPLGKKGEHAHYWIYENGIVKDRKASNIKKSDIKENRDILEWLE